jgi:maltose alpha-D-glucosyltransferase/alpha-amylase
VYGFQAVNVDSQRRTPHSLLHWMRRIIQIRQTTRAFGRGDIRFLKPANHRILAYLRTFEEEQILVVNNLAGTSQAGELDLKHLKGAIPIEMFGGSPFPRIGDLPYLLTMGPYQFHWFKLRWL